jgi:nitroreductase
MNEIYTRVSVRKFEDRPVEPEKIEQLLRAAMAAPSAGNQQPWEFYVVTDRDMLEKLSRTTPYAGCAKAAPVAIVSAYREKLWAPMYAQIDLSIAMENLWLACSGQGLGGVWLGIAPIEERMKAVEEIVGIPAGQRAFAIFPLGYPAEQRQQQDRWDPSRVHLL